MFYMNNTFGYAMRVLILVVLQGYYDFTWT
jgi:hypothetical protein